MADDPRVPIITPSGRRGTIPRSKLDAALRVGARLLPTAEQLPTVAPPAIGKIMPKVEEVPEVSPPPGAGVLASPEMLLPAMQGLTLGYGDEMASNALASAAGMMGLDPQGKAYGWALDKHRKSLEETRKHRPLASLAAEAVGSLPLMAIPAAGLAADVMGILRGKKAADAMRAANAVKDMTWLKSLGKNAVTGAVTGGATGAGASEGGAMDRARGALQGARTGGILSALIPAGGAAAKKVTQWGVNAIADTPVAAAAAKTMPGILLAGPEMAEVKVLEKLAKDHKTLKQIERRLNLYDAHGKQPVLADLARTNIRNQADAVMSVPGSTRAAAEARLYRRAEGAGSRILGDLEAGTGTTSDFDMVSKALQATRSEKAAPLYDAAYARGAKIDDPQIQEYLRLPLFPQALETGRRIAALEKQTLPNDVLNLKVLDYVKRGLDDIVYSGKRTGAIGKAEVRALQDVNRKFVGRLDELVPEYAVARNAWAGPTRVLEAGEAGRNYADLTGSQLRELLEDEFVTKSEREHFLLGAVDSIRTAVRKADDGANIYRKVFGSPEKRKQLEQLFNDRAKFKVFANKMAMERDMRRTHDWIRGNSRTAQRQAELADLGDETLAVVPELLRGNVSGPVMTFLKNRSAGNVGRTAESMVPLLTGDPRKALDQLRRAQMRLDAQAAQGRTSGRSLGAVGGLLSDK